MKPRTKKWCIQAEMNASKLTQSLKCEQSFPQRMLITFFLIALEICKKKNLPVLEKQRRMREWNQVSLGNTGATACRLYCETSAHRPMLVLINKLPHTWALIMWQVQTLLVTCWGRYQACNQVGGQLGNFPPEIFKGMFSR